MTCGLAAVRRIQAQRRSAAALGTEKRQPDFEFVARAINARHFQRHPA
jgi:hypothetical protein